jgi:hypothetical protein
MGMEASAEDECMTGMVVLGYKGVEGVTNERRMTEDDSWRKTSGRREEDERSELAFG